jgi:hypothetical protein
MAVMGRELTRSANVDVGLCRHMDIYSCFPIAVSVVARELGFDSSDGSRLTVTGGLPCVRHDRTSRRSVSQRCIGRMSSFQVPWRPRQQL